MSADAFLQDLDSIRKLSQSHIAKRRRLFSSPDDAPLLPRLPLALSPADSLRPELSNNDAFGKRRRIIAPPETEQALYAAFQTAFAAERDPDLSFPVESPVLYRVWVLRPKISQIIIVNVLFLNRIIRRNPHILIEDERAGIVTLEQAVRQYARLLGPDVVRIEEITDPEPCLVIHRPQLPWARPLFRPKGRIKPKKAGKPPPKGLEWTPSIPLRVVEPSEEEQELERMVERPSVAEIVGTEQLEELSRLLDKPSAKELLVREQFKSRGRVYFREYCFWGTKAECQAATGAQVACSRVHFRMILRPYTDQSLGDCSYLNTCHRMETCKFLHYEIDDEEIATIDLARLNATLMPITRLWPAQWLNCDIRKLDFSILGKFSVIMADPPWDIHMTLPYGTMNDDEMRQMAISELQDDGFIFLWVTGRAMELGRECLAIWGYERVGELVWVKTNQLQRIIRTGRTGHWLNHSKEHCLIGIKGKPKFNAWIDTDVLVAEVRETSRKPDEVYGLIDRLCPNSRKIGGWSWPAQLTLFLTTVHWMKQKSLDECTTRGTGG